ncbi:MAG: DUF3592 domain-containing protein [Rhodospirillaceae bacterium]
MINHAAPIDRKTSCIQELYRVPGVISVHNYQIRGLSLMAIRFVGPVDRVEKGARDLFPGIPMKFIPAAVPDKGNCAGPSADAARMVSTHHAISLPLMRGPHPVITALFTSIVAIAIVVALLYPIYCASGSIMLALTAGHAEAMVAKTEWIQYNTNTDQGKAQAVTFQFFSGKRQVVFTRQSQLFDTNILNYNRYAEPYRMGSLVSILYDPADPEGSARVFDPVRFFLGLFFYMAFVSAIGASVLYAIFFLFRPRR